VLKKLATWALVAFLVFWVFSAPDAAAAAVRTVGTGLRDLADSALVFVESLTT
jgi:hypothetical protein